MKLIMENWRRFTDSVSLNEITPAIHAARIASLAHSGTQMGLDQSSLVSEMLETIAVEIALIYKTGTLPKIFVRSGQILAPSWTGQSKKLPKAGRRIMHAYKNLPGWQFKLQNLFSNPQTRKWALKNIVKWASNFAGRWIPAVLVIYTLIEIGKTWHDEGQGIDIWDPTSFGFKHAISKGDVTAYGGEGPSFKPGEETGLINKFKEWPEEQKFTYCSRPENSGRTQCKLWVPEPRSELETYSEDNR